MVKYRVQKFLSTSIPLQARESSPHYLETAALTRAIARLMRTQIFITRRSTTFRTSVIAVIGLPPICSKIVSCLGLSSGPKVKNNPRIPDFILNSSEEKIAAFLSQIFDDEGSVDRQSKHIKTNFNIEARHEKSMLIEGLNELFHKLGVTHTSIYYSKPCALKRRILRKKRVAIAVHSYGDLKKLLGIFSLQHATKKRSWHVSLIHSSKSNT